MDLCETQCCAVMEITGLSYYPNPESAMRRLYGMLKDYSEAYFDDDDVDVTINNLKIPAFLTFTGVVKCTDGGHIHMACPTSYGPDFAAFIKKEKLGAVTDSPGRINRVNVPRHTVKVWVWAPSSKGLKAWFRRKGF